MHTIKNILSKEIFLYIWAIILCCLFLFWVMQLWKAAINIPFEYNWDTLYQGMTIKGMIDNGWYISNPFIGAPAGVNLADFPANGNLDMAIMKFISLIFPDWAITLNLYFLLTFPLTTITSLLVFRKLKASKITSLVGSLLLTFMPYHFLQGENHIFVAAYYLVPLIILVCLWLYEDDFSLKLYRNNIVTKEKKSINWKSICSIFICIGMGLTFIYYPFFSCFFLILTGIGTSISRKKWQPLFNSLILIGIIIFIFAIFYIPTVLYHFENGSNQAIIRNPTSTEVYGLRIIQLLLPVSGNNNPLFAAFADKYNTNPLSFLLVNENQSAALGLIGSIGFMILAVWVLYRWFRPFSADRNHIFRIIDHLSFMNLTAVILGTAGGLGTLIAYLVFPEIRTYTRISIFIAFFSILTIVLLADYLIRKTTFSKIVIWIMVFGFLFVGINDQVSAKMVPEYQSIKTEFFNDLRFVQEIESKYPADKMIFQLPYTVFPESNPQNKMSDYDLFRGYLHSSDIHWSYGAIKGRYGDYWESQMAAKPVSLMVQELSFAGFNGIYVDSYGYEDNGKAVLDSLSLTLNQEPLKSDNNRLYFFDMTSYNKNLRAIFTLEEWEQHKIKALYPLYVEFRDGFIQFTDIIQLCTSEGEIVLTNFTDQDKEITISTTFASLDTAVTTLTIDSTLFTDTLIINNAIHYEKTVTVPPGKWVIKFTCDGEGMYYDKYQKNIVWDMFNFKVTEKY